jgi:hypothetical protein
MVDAGRRQFLGATVAALVAAGFSDTALGSDMALEQLGPRGEPESEGGFWRARTEEHLREEMRCWVGGIKDFHDLVIDHVKERCRRVGLKPVRPPRSDVELRGEIASKLSVRIWLEQTCPTLEDLRRWEEERHEQRLHDAVVKGNFLSAVEDAGSLYLDERGALCVA